MMSQATPQKISEASVDNAAEAFRLVHPEKYLQRFVEQDVRPDGRSLHGFRDTVINVGEISTADGSALVRLGQTTALCGIKAELANPPQDKPTQGWLVPNVTLPTLCNPDIRRGPPPQEAQVLSQFVNEVLVGAVSLESLCLAPAQLSWVLYIDVYVLNDAGNITDACALAALAALHDLRLPKMTDITSEGDLPTIVSPRAVPLQLKALPVAVSFGQFNDTVLTDPTVEEESLLNATVTVVEDALCCEQGDTSRKSLLKVVQPSPASTKVSLGGRTLSVSHLQQCCAQAVTRAVHIKSLLDATSR